MYYIEMKIQEKTGCPLWAGFLARVPHFQLVSNACCGGFP